jgi:hypothetical protein
MGGANGLYASRGRNNSDVLEDSLNGGSRREPRISGIAQGIQPGSANEVRLCFESRSGCDPPGIQGGINLFEVQQTDR